MKNDLVDDFKKSLEDDQIRLETAIKILEVCREYINRHYEKSIYGTHQKTLIDVIDEFLSDKN